MSHPLLDAKLRRRPLIGAAAGLVSAMSLPHALLAAPAQVSIATGIEPVPALAADRVYFEETGHSVSGPFWRLWRSYGLDGFGYPISEPFEQDGIVNQYFQRARAEMTPEGTVRLGLLGIEAGAVEPAPAPTGDPPSGPDVRYAPETGHTVTGAFVYAYDRWKAVLGAPIAPEHPTENGGYVQYFANGRLEWDSVNGVRLGLLGAELAAQRGVSTTPAPAPAGATPWSAIVAALVEDEAARRQLGKDASGGQGFVPEFGEQWVAVSLARQRVTAYEHTRAVFTDLCSTGDSAKGLTGKGVFTIWRRVENETMDSTSVGFPKGDPRYYHLENVLYTQYFDNTGEALHYAWWHNNFGRPMSYGCVNLRLATAKWFWDWATIGTRVVVA